MKKRKNSLILLISIFVGILFLVLFVAVVCSLNTLMAPDHYLFGEMNQTAQFVLMLLIFAIVLLGIGWIMRKCKIQRTESLEEWLDLWDAFGKWKWVLVVIWVLVFYCCATSATYVTEDTIIAHSPIYPAGVKYAYEDISQIKTGFGGKIFGIKEYTKKGSFFYILTMKDGRRIVFSQPGTNEDIERYNQDSYLELEEFDQKLMELGIPKESDESNWEACDMDQVYVDRFLRIIRNK